MRMTVERLRKWLLAGAVLLVMTVLGFLFYARWKAHRFLTDLPAKLGVDVRQETNGYTYSQTVKGKTVFTLHSAKAIQHQDGKYTLHDVGIAVYNHGQTPQESPQTQDERVDRIYGKEFDLDQAAGVVKAVGEVHIDLQAPAAKDSAGKMDYAAGKDLKASAPQAKPEAGEPQKRNIHEVGLGDNRLIHVKTSNLVYLRKLGVAATDEEVEFEYNGLTGHARGAEYNADSGVLTLQQAVKVSGIEEGKPILLTAARAELDRNNHRVTMKDARYLTVSESGDNATARQQVAAHHAVVSLREDGDVDKIEGDGGVSIAAGDGMHLTGTRGSVLLNPIGKPTAAHVFGDVKYAADDDQRHAQGSSSEAKVDFDKDGNAHHVALSGNVMLTDRVMTHAANAKANVSNIWSERHLTAPLVEMTLTAVAGRSHPESAKASGGAKLRIIDAAPEGKRQTTEMAADVLNAQFVTGKEGPSRLDEVTGTGKTFLARTSDQGVVETSAGDSLEVHFRDSAARAAHAEKSALGTGEIASAVQQGNVVLTRKSPAKDATSAEQTERVTAARANFDGATHLVTLSGKVQLSSPDQTLWAERVTMDQITGDATADGSIKASYRQGTQSDAVHVLSDRAELNKANGLATFFGSNRSLARLWQAGSQVEARVLEFNQKLKSLKAHGEGTGAPMSVRTVLVSKGGGDIASTAVAPLKKDANRKPVVVRIASREMSYSDQSREAQFTGGVRVESSDGVMRGDRADVFLAAPDSKKQAAAPQQTGTSFLGGGVERVNVTGAIEISQQGRRATGEQLVYTTSDGLFILTGTRSDPPRVVDQLRGVVTGEELRFRSADESIVISNGDRGGSGPRVHTETRVKRDR